jgi:hypothetical protein
VAGNNANPSTAATWAGFFFFFGSRSSSRSNCSTRHDATAH